MANVTVCQRPMSLHRLRLCYEAQVIGSRRAMDEVSIEDVEGLVVADTWSDYYELNKGNVQLVDEYEDAEILFACNEEAKARHAAVERMFRGERA